MKIITTNPIIDEADFHSEDWFSNASSSTRAARKKSREAARSKRKKEGKDFGSRVKKGIDTVAQSGILDTLLQKNQNVPLDPTANGSIPPPPPAPTQEGMSTTTKVLIGLGVAAAIGGLVYWSTRTK